VKYEKDIICRKKILYVEKRYYMSKKGTFMKNDVGKTGKRTIIYIHIRFCTHITSVTAC